MAEPVILAVLAHPDDETFGMGGTLALYSMRGVKVHLICATRGEAGEAPEEMLRPYRTVARLREAELRCAVKALGLAGVHFLDYRDSGMAGAPDNNHPDALAAASIEDVSRKVASIIRKLRPDVVITFDPVGGFFHPDHLAIQKATVLALSKACDDKLLLEGYPPFKVKKLYFHVIPRGFLKFAVFMIRLSGGNPHRWGVNKDIDVQSIACLDFPVHAVIDVSQALSRKEQAAA